MANCEFCKKEFKVKINTKGRFCGYECYWKSIHGMRVARETEFKKGQLPWNYGTKEKFNCKTCGIKFENRSNGRPTYCNKCLDRKAIGRQVGKSNIGRKESDVNKKKRLTILRAVFSKKEPTSIEKIVYDELKARGILFEKQKLVGGRFIVDAYIPELNLVIECDGNYWHSREDNQKKDKRKNLFLKEHGFDLLRLTETEIKSGEFRERMVM